MEPLDLVLTSNRVVLADRFGPAAVGIAGGRISAITPPDAAPPARQRCDVGDLAILPGAVDTHVHINDPGTDWEGFASAGRAAAAGGITTFIDMPLNGLPVTTDAEALAAEQRAAAGRCAVDYGFWGGVIPGGSDDLSALIDAYVLGFKCFLCPSGLEAFPHVEESDLRRAMPILADAGHVLLVHAEDHPAILDAAANAEDAGDYSAFLASRPPAAEVRAIETVAELAKRFGCRVHIVHVASAQAAEAVARARLSGTPLTAETCPHYLSFAAEEIPAGRCEYKCATPIRRASHRENLWRALEAGTLDMITSDHSPCPPGLKHLDTGDLTRAWGGIASLQVSLAASWTGARARGAGLPELARWMAAEPARLAGLDGKKGRIQVEADADLVVFDPDSSFTVDAATLYHRHPVTPYEGKRLYGIVRQTFVRPSCADTWYTIAPAFSTKPGEPR